MGLVVLGSPEGEPKVFVVAFMPLRSLPRGGSCPDTAACPTSCRLRGAVLPPPTSALISHPGTHPLPAFVVALHATTSPAGCSFANFASVRVGTRSSTASPRSRPPRSPRHPPASSLSTSRRLVPPSVAQQHDLPAHEWPSALPPLLSLCSSAPRSTRCDKNAPRTAATAPPDKTLPGSPPAPGTCRKQTAARLSVRALSGVAETPSSWPCLLSTLPPPPALREIPLHSRQSPLAAIRSALRRPNSASATSHPETHTGGCLRSAGCTSS